MPELLSRNAGLPRIADEFAIGSRSTGYEGPVNCEPIAKAITELSAGSDDEALALTSAALRETLLLN